MARRLGPRESNEYEPKSTFTNRKRFANLGRGGVLYKESFFPRRFLGLLRETIPEMGAVGIFGVLTDSRNYPPISSPSYDFERIINHGNFVPESSIVL